VDISLMFIALLTDFGTRDHFAASMKGVILSIHPKVTIIDITHEIDPQDIRGAAFTLSACYRDFPEGTVFVAVVDPGVGSRRRAIAAASGDYRFVAPDNGVLSFALAKDARVFELTNSRYFARNISNTFHGRDIFAPVAAHLSNGIGLSQFGREINDAILFELPGPFRGSHNELTAQVIHIDRFGNLITNLAAGDLPSEFRLELKGVTIERNCRYYAEAGPGEVFSILGSAGFLEVVVNRGSAEERFSAQVGDKLAVRT
jgi:S-adenosylmethionine hydrolase